MRSVVFDIPTRGANHGTDALNDPRVAWMQGVVSRISSPSFDEYFTDFERARSAGVARETIMEFLSISIEVVLLCFSRRRRRKERRR